MESIETVLVLLTMGVAFLLIGLFRSSDLRRLIRTGIRAEGVVFQVLNDGHSSTTTYYPVIRFVTEQQDQVTEKYRTGGNRYTYKEGEQVHVIYDPKDPGRFILDDVRSKAASPVFTYSGIVLIAVSVGLFILGLRG